VHGTVVMMTMSNITCHFGAHTTHGKRSECLIVTITNSNHNPRVV